MLHLLLAAAIAAPPAWVTDFKLRPKPMSKYAIYGKNAPEAAVIMPPKRKAILRIDGPVELRLSAHGLMKKMGRKLSDPGELTVRVDKGPREVLALPRKPIEHWFVRRQPFWRVGGEAALTLSIAAGAHKVTVAPSKKLAAGYALIIELREPAAPAGAAAVAAAPSDDLPEDAQPEGPAAEPSDAAVAPQPEAASPAPATATPEPPIEAPEPPEPPPTDDEPPLVASPSAAEPEIVAGPLGAVRPGLRIIDPPPIRTIKGPTGQADFIGVTIESGLRLDVTGPGTLILDLHAHRSETHAESLEPVVVGLLLNDVLVNTLSIDEPGTDEFKAEGDSFALSRRITVRWPIPVGSQRLQLSLSDNAVIGASVRARFLDLGASDEPLVLDTATAREKSDLRLGSEPPSEVSGASGIAVLGGAWLPNAVSKLGGAAVLEGLLGIPALAPSVGVGLTAVFSRLEESWKIEDTRTPDGSGRARLTATHVPLLLDIRAAIQPVAGLGIEVGAGGGVILLWSETRSRRGTHESGLRASPALLGRAAVTVAVGPGAIIAMAAFIAGLPVSADNVGGYDPGAVLPAIGYRVTLGGD